MPSLTIPRTGALASNILQTERLSAGSSKFLEGADQSVTGRSRRTDIGRSLQRRKTPQRACADTRVPAGARTAQGARDLRFPFLALGQVLDEGAGPPKARPVALKASRRVSCPPAGWGATCSAPNGKGRHLSGGPSLYSPRCSGQQRLSSKSRARCRGRGGKDRSRPWRLEEIGPEVE
jgi:hypothetical protein